MINYIFYPPSCENKNNNYTDYIGFRFKSNIVVITPIKILINQCKLINNFIKDYTNNNNEYNKEKFYNKKYTEILIFNCSYVDKFIKEQYYILVDWCIYHNTNKWKLKRKYKNEYITSNVDFFIEKNDQNILKNILPKVNNINDKIYDIYNKTSMEKLYNMGNFSSYFLCDSLLECCAILYMLYLKKFTITNYKLLPDSIEQKIKLIIKNKNYVSMLINNNYDDDDDDDDDIFYMENKKIIWECLKRQSEKENKLFESNIK